MGKIRLDPAFAVIGEESGKHQAADVAVRVLRRENRVDGSRLAQNPFGIGFADRGCGDGDCGIQTSDKYCSAHNGNEARRCEESAFPPGKHTREIEDFPKRQPR